ncbi:MAG: protein phosphatase 2C domain-containing protein [Pseudomonadota bacterium]
MKDGVCGMRGAPEPLVSSQDDGGPEMLYSRVIPPDAMMGFETCARTDVGCVRKLNEDSLLAMPRAGIWLVADGMGGHTAGDFASQTIAGVMKTSGIPSGAVDLRARVTARLDVANAAIQAQAAELGSGTIGATLALLMISQDHFACLWSGDSRVYRMRGARLTRVTRDHTEVQALLDTGAITPEQAETWPRKNVITRAIGVTPQPETDMVDGALADGDLFLICSDGLTEYYDDAELARVLHDSAAAGLEATCNQLVDTALARGGKDNVSVVLVRCQALGHPAMPIDGAWPELEGSQ